MFFQTEIVLNDQHCPSWYCESTASTLAPATTEAPAEPLLDITTDIFEALLIGLIVAAVALAIYAFISYIRTERNAYMAVRQGAEEPIELNPIIQSHPMPEAQAEQGSVENQSEGEEIR